MSTSRNTERKVRFNKMSRRADSQMRSWRKSLSPKKRGELSAQLSPWGRNGGSIIAPKRRRTKAQRDYEQLTREREWKFRAEQAAYEDRRVAPWKIVKPHQSGNLIVSSTAGAI